MMELLKDMKRFDVGRTLVLATDFREAGDTIPLLWRFTDDHAFLEK